MPSGASLGSIGADRHVLAGRIGYLRLVSARLVIFNPCTPSERGAGAVWSGRPAVSPLSHDVEIVESCLHLPVGLCRHIQLQREVGLSSATTPHLYLDGGPTWVIA